MSGENEGKVPINIAERVASDSSLDIDGYRDVVLLRPRRGGRSGGHRRGQELSAWKLIRSISAMAWRPRIASTSARPLQRGSQYGHPKRVLGTFHRSAQSQRSS